MNSIRGLFRAKDLCNYIRDGISDAFSWVYRIRFGGGPGISGMARLIASGLTGASFFGMMSFGFDFLRWLVFRAGITIGKSSLLSSRLESSYFDSKTLLIDLVIHLFIQHWKLVLQRIIKAHMGNTKFRGFLVERGERNILGRKKGTHVR